MNICIYFFLLCIIVQHLKTHFLIRSFVNDCNYQRWSRGHNARGQGQGHKKKSKAKAKDSLSEDRHSRGQGQECSRPRPRTKDTSASALQKKKVFTKIFQTISKKKKGLHKNFSSDLHKKTFSKTCLKRSTKF